MVLKDAGTFSKCLLGFEDNDSGKFPSNITDWGFVVFMRNE